jgi:excisionase family DNA binding protein
MSDKEKPKEYLRVSEASKLLGVHANTLRNWDTQNILKPVRIGPRKERRYKREDVMKFLESDTEKKG